MTPLLTPTDRTFAALAKWVERPILASVASQRLLRVLFALSVRLSSRLPKGTLVAEAEDGSLRITPPDVPPDAPVLLYLHGGGFTIGSPRTHAPLAAHLARAAEMTAVLPRYPLAPEGPFPAAQTSLFSWYRNALRHAPAPAAICGDSAGACLSLQLMQHARDNDLPMPKAMGLIGPAADFRGDIDARFAAAPDEKLLPPAWIRRIERLYVGDHDRNDPAISPLAGDLSGLPPTLLQAAEGEVLAQDARALAAALPEAELSLWPGLQHVWHIHAGRAPAADAALTEMGLWLRNRAA